MKFLKLILLFTFLSCASFAQDKKAVTFDWWQVNGASQTIVFDASYQAVLDRGTALGYTLPSPAQQIKQNQLVVDLKAAGIWSLLDVFYVFATDGDSDFATLNWINPAQFQSSKVNSPTFTTNSGFNGNGTTSYINTNYATLSGTKVSLNSASFGLYMTTVVTIGQDTQIAGTDDANNNLAINNTTVQRINNSTNNLNNSVQLNNTIGYKAINRSSVSDNQLYRDNVKFDRIANSTGLSDRSFRIGTRGANFNNATYSMFFAGASLSETMHNNLWVYFVTYFTSL